MIQDPESERKKRKDSIAKEKDSVNSSVVHKIFVARQHSTRMITKIDAIIGFRISVHT